MLSPRFIEAFELACNLHRTQLRKGTSIPYIAHLMAVSALVLENGGDEDQAIAALLHDAVEDQGGLKILDEIRERFGERVARIVDGCTDSYTILKKPWLERKKAYLEKLKIVDVDVHLVSLADKVHNVRSLLNDLNSEGPTVWKRFNGGKDGTIWYYSMLSHSYPADGCAGLLRQFRKSVEELQQIS